MITAPINHICLDERGVAYIAGTRIKARHVAIERQKGSFWRLAGQAKVDGQLASEAEIMATIADRKEQK